MKKLTEGYYLELWKDICLYEAYKQSISYDDYIISLSDKYCNDVETMYNDINETIIKANDRINCSHYLKKNYPPIFRIECKEEEIKTAIEYSIARENLKRELFLDDELDSYKKTLKTNN